MGKTAREIVGDKADEIIGKLNKALADEWLAYLQYTLASSIICEAPVAGALREVGEEELEHAGELAERIMQLGGKPIVDPREFYKQTNCGYSVPTGKALDVLADAIKGEGCAIKVYNGIALMCKDSDPITYELMLHIMKEEMEHEDKFGNLEEWMGKKG